MKKVAIVGVGPRGLHALECLYQEISKLDKSMKVHTTLFEIAQHPGGGSVWNLSQPETNLMNISERALQELKERPHIIGSHFSIPKFPGYNEWSVDKGDVPSDKIDQFPPRKKMGHYLNERFQSIYRALRDENLATIVQEEVKSIENSNQQFELVTSSTTICYADEVLLAIGHQKTRISDQIKGWARKINKPEDKILFEDPYPVSTYTQEDKITPSQTVAIRGFGLAMIDVCRALTVGYGGRFDTTNKKTLECTYTPSEQSIKTIIPFSLDGLPPVPKPLGKELDQLFAPSEEALKDFGNRLKKYALNTSGSESIDPFIDALADAIVDVYITLPLETIPHDECKTTLADIIRKWIFDQSYTHRLFLDHDLSVSDSVKEHLNMALGLRSISLDYCIGQVWRHCQPTIYKELSHANLSDATIKRVIELDEQSKRYSYGPPVESMQQLLALENYGVLQFDFAENPNIKVHADGWQFYNEENSKKDIEIMINSVLDGPKILEVESTLVQQLLIQTKMTPVHSDLGIETDTDGTFHHLQKTDNQKALAMVGRLCKGSVIGVDAILECFGPRIKDWAQSTAYRLVSIP